MLYLVEINKIERVLAYHIFILLRIKRKCKKEKRIDEEYFNNLWTKIKEFEG